MTSRSKLLPLPTRPSHFSHKFGPLSVLLSGKRLPRDNSASTVLVNLKKNKNEGSMFPGLARAVLGLLLAAHGNLGVGRATADIGWLPLWFVPEALQVHMMKTAIGAAKQEIC